MHNHLSGHGLSVGPSLSGIDTNNAASVTLNWPGASANHAPQTPLRARLAECAPSAESDLLLSELVAAEENAKQFLAQQAELRIAELEQRRDQLWSECRALEESKSESGDGALSGSLRIAQSELANLKQSRAESRPAIRSRYPTPQELEVISRFDAASRMLLARQEFQIGTLREAIESARQKMQSISEKLFETNEKLRLADSQLNAARSMAGK